jgi:hypothetical protein
MARRLSLGLVGIVVGGAFALGSGIHNPAVAVMSVFAAAVVAILIPRLFTSVLLGLLGAGLLFVVLAWPLLAQDRPHLAASWRTKGQQSFSTRESLDLVRTYGLDVEDTVKESAKKLALVRWLVIAAVGSVLFASALPLWRVAGALLCSFLGTLLVWSGLVILLMFKGSMPVRWIEAHVSACGLAILIMTAFGAVEQFVLCQRAGRKRAAARHTRRDDEEDSKPNWRSH